MGALTQVGSSVSGMSYDTPQPYNQQWNFGIQRELPGRLLVNASYVGSHSVKLPLNLSPNNLQPQYFGAPGDQARVAFLTALVPNPFFNIIKTGTLAAASVQRQQLLAAFPQFTSSVSSIWDKPPRSTTPCRSRCRRATATAYPC